MRQGFPFKRAVGYHGSSWSSVLRLTFSLRAVAVVALLMAPAVILSLGAGAATQYTVTDAEATPIKAGSRVVFTWTTPFEGTSVVKYRQAAALSPTFYSFPAPGQLMGFYYMETHEASIPSKRHLVVMDLSPDREYQYYVETKSLDGSRVATSPVQTFKTVNAYKLVTNATAAEYVANVMVRFDWDIRSPTEWTKWRNGMTQFAIRMNDATDGHVKIGKVILVDSYGQTFNGHSFCDGFTVCPTGADVLYFTVLPYDSHTYGLGIDTPDPINLGRLGQLVYSWQGPDHIGRVLAHEYLHYAGGLEDQYSEASAINGAVPCEVRAYDISIMNNNNVQTELDSMATPCEFTQKKGYSSWDILRGVAGNTPGKFTLIPDRGLPDAGPYDAGPYFRLDVIDRVVP